MSVEGITCLNYMLFRSWEACGFSPLDLLFGAALPLIQFLFFWFSFKSEIEAHPAEMMEMTGTLDLPVHAVFKC